MKKPAGQLIAIMSAVIIASMIIAGCKTTFDKKCMPLTSSSKKAADLAWEGQKILADGFTVKAIELFKQALELDSAFVAANLWYGQNAGLGNIKRHEYFRRSERNMANVPEAEQHMVKSYLALEKGDRETIVNELNEILKLYPEDKYMLRLMAVRYYSFGEYENALEYAKKSYQADTSFSTIANYQGYILAAMGKSDEAEKWYKKSIEMNPDVPLYYNNYGQLLRATGRVDEAIEMHSKAIAIGSDYSGNLFLGHCYTATDNYSLAREYYSKAYDLAVNDAQRSTQLSFIVYTYLYEGKLQEACESYDKRSEFLKKIGNMDIEIINNDINKGFCYLIYDDFANAEKCINEATGLISSLSLTEAEKEAYNRYAIFWKGWLQALTGKSADAQKSMEEFRASIKDENELNTSMKFYWTSLQGIVAFSKKKWTDAAAFLVQANGAVPYYIAGLAYLNSGDKVKAKEVFDRIAGNKLIGNQLALVKPLAKSRQDELNK
jgi:tetratricopeptide (TPR) repeat protein